MFLYIQFLHPEFLYGLFLLAIPIILHLFSLKRYKKVYFSNFNFLEALQQQKKNSSKLKNLLLLLLRLLTIACIVIAFSTPYLPEDSQRMKPNENNQVILYIDNSHSMSNTGTRGTLLEEAKKHLYDIMNSYPNGTHFRLLTNDDANDVVLTKEQMYDALGQVKIHPGAKKLSELYKEVGELTQGESATLFILSDFQKANCDFHSFVPDTTLESVMLILHPENLNNVYIKDIAFEQAFHRKNQIDKIRITIANDSEKNYPNLPVTLTINEKKKNISQINLDPNSENTLEINYLNTEEGFCKGMVEISDLPIVFDNKFFFSYNVDDHSEILHIWQKQQNPYFGKMFSDSLNFAFTSLPVHQVANQSFSRYSLIILDEINGCSNGLESLLEEYVIQGGNLFMIAAPEATEAQNRFLGKLQAPLLGDKDTNTIISYIETQASLFRNAFAKEDKQAVLPRIRKFYRLTSATGTEKLLQDKRGNTLLSSKTFGKGNIYLSAFSFTPGNSDMVYHPLFIPLMANMACKVNSALNTSYFLNTDKPVIISNKFYTANQPLTIRQEEQMFEFIPDTRKDFSGDLLLTNNNHIQEAGIYKVMQKEQVIDILAWNYERTESQLTFCEAEELQKQLPHARVENIKTTNINYNNDLIKEIVLQDRNKYLTRWFLIWGILFLLAEQFVWRRKLN